MSRLSSVPSVDKVLGTEKAADLSESYGRPLTLQAIRATLEEIRASLESSDETNTPGIEIVLAGAESRLEQWTAPTLEPVINATGVILHTNLGRAPLSAATITAMANIARGYTNLEFDLESGRRGDRFAHVEPAISELTGAEAALVVNNNASAVLLVLSALAARKRVIIARSQLVEIGGGFRMPEVMRQSGARLVEVGTTNKVRPSDYEAEFSDSALVMWVHRSNFKMIGFTAEPQLAEIAQAAHKAGLTVVNDLGSGALVDTAAYGMAHEPTVQESIAAGADVTCFSGDKLVGGPQSGIIVGKADLIDRVRKHPLARAVRADKTCLAGVEATFRHYMRDEIEREIPVWRMIAMSIDDVKIRAESWMRVLGFGDVRESQSTLGGGSLPGESLRTYVLSLSVPRPADFLKTLRRKTPPIVARTERDRILLDPRTVLAEQDASLIDSLRSAFMEIQ